MAALRVADRGVAERRPSSITNEGSNDMGKVKGSETGVTETNTSQGARGGGAGVKAPSIDGPAYGGSNKAKGGGAKPKL